MQACSKKIVIEPHNPLWSSRYQEESLMLKQEMGSNIIETHHVGSTAVPLLAAKPVIDIIVVVNCLKKAYEQLAKIENYKYKGELNIPLRDFYSNKTNEKKIHLHVLQPDHGDIKLNLAFRDFLRNNPKQRLLYEQKKIWASQQNNATEKAANGIPNYNLMKNDVIMDILNLASFDGYCVRRVTQKNEIAEFKKTRLLYCNEEENINNQKLVIYKGTQIIGTAELNNFVKILFLHTKTEESFDKFLNTIEKWAKLKSNPSSP